MEIRIVRDTEIHAESLEVYEPPMLDEIGEFAALTCADAAGTVVDGSGYYPQ